MKLHDRYFLQSVMSVALATLVLCTLLLVSIDLFSHLDSYATKEIPALTIAHMSFLYIPGAILFALGPSLLFSTAFFLSNLQANNEMICLFNTGLSYQRLVSTLLVLGLFFSVSQFFFSELVAIPASKQRSQLADTLFGLSSTYDNRNITLKDLEGHYVVHAQHYNEERKRLSEVLLVFLDESGSLDRRIDADSAHWEEQKGYWSLEGVKTQAVSKDKLDVQTTRAQSVELPSFTLEPSYFRNLSTDIKTMALHPAYTYLRRMKILDPSQWSTLATDYANRVLGCLNPLVMLFIACAISYKYKKNVLLFSIITSLALAVVYYVVQMVTLIMAKQGVIGPVWGMAIPMIVIVCIALLERRALK